MNEKLDDENIFDSNSEEIKCFFEDFEPTKPVKKSGNLFSKLWQSLFHVKRAEPEFAIAQQNQSQSSINYSINIATMSIAGKVHLHTNAMFYAIQLKALHSEAEKLGYYFSQTKTDTELPSILTIRLARAAEYQRKCFLYPNDPGLWDKWTDESMADGYAEAYLQSILSALAAQGIYLQEGQHAPELLAEAEFSDSTEKPLPLAQF